MIAVITFEWTAPEINSSKQFFNAICDFDVHTSYFKSRDDAETFVREQFDEGDGQAYYLVDGGKVFCLREEVVTKEIR